MKDFNFFILQSYSCCHVCRQDNVVTYVLTKRAKLSFPLLVEMKFVPPNIQNVYVHS